MRLSPLSLANDDYEGKLVGSVFSELCEVKGLSPSVTDLAKFLVSSFPKTTEGFAFCMPENGDLLSQWRAYADDARGVCLTFERDKLTQDYGNNIFFGKRYFELIDVTYGNKALTELIIPFVAELGQLVDRYGELPRLKPGYTVDNAVDHFSDRENDSGKFFEKNKDLDPDAIEALMKLTNNLHFKIYSYKVSHFHEEKEWRLIRYRHRVHFDEIKYQVNAGTISPYIDTFISGGAKKALKSVTLGPKNSSNINWVRAFLKSNDMEHIDVVASTITSYR